MKKHTSVLAIVGVVFGVLLERSFGPPGAGAGEGQSGIDWQAGPGSGQIGGVAKIRIPEGYRFAGRDGVRRFLELTQNPVSGKELGVLVPPEEAGDMWFVIFEFNSSATSKTTRRTTWTRKPSSSRSRQAPEQSNEERRKRGWATMDILGWHTQPRYDPVTNNLTWAIRGSSEGDEVVNYSVRLLGRKGVMDVDLVLNPTQVAGTVPEFDELMTGFEFTSGNRYAEFMAGDKVAANTD